MEKRVRFELLYREHAGAVRAYALRRGDASTADDVVADVFLVAWRRLDAVPELPLPWLLGVARRVLANRRRGSDRREALVARLGFEASAGTEPWESQGDPQVARALQGLRERDRELLLLVAWDGLTHAEAAEALGLRKGAFTVALHRARRRFARLLSERPEGSDQSAALEVST